MELPPRARRIPIHNKNASLVLGTTSACAENTRFSFVILMISWNYLRVRGEYTLTRHYPNFSAELPPRARRIHETREIFESQGGTTSACAENTTTMGSLAHPNGNYLRVRGEYFATAGTTGLDRELPPRARRIPVQLGNQHNWHGTTYACAENTG